MRATIFKPEFFRYVPYVGDKRASSDVEGTPSSPIYQESFHNGPIHSSLFIRSAGS